MIKSADENIEEIINRYKNAVYGLALVKTGSRADADDVFQEVFIAYYRAEKTFKDEEHRKAWLLRTTINMSRRITASTWRKRTVPLSEQENEPFVFKEKEENTVWEALEDLPENYRLPIYLFYFQELDTREIAKALSTTSGAVRMRLSRGRELLRKSLKGGDYFEE